MSLTNSETRILDEQAAVLRRTDPQLHRMLTRGRPVPRVVDVVTITVGILLAVTIGVGVALQLPVVCAVGWTAVMGLSVVRGMFADPGH